MAKTIKVSRSVSPPLFTEKELQVIRYIVREKTNEEMAVLMKKSIRTIEGYRKAVYEKSKSKSVVGLVLYALKNNICRLS